MAMSREQRDTNLKIGRKTAMESYARRCQTEEHFEEGVAMLEKFRLEWLERRKRSNERVSADGGG